METRQVWIASDGREFADEASALRHDGVLKIVRYLYEHSDLYWRDISPEKVVEALLQRFVINEKP